MRELEEIRALCDAATPGPWDINGDCLCVPRHIGDGEWEADQLSEYIEGEGTRAFIAASRALIPEMAEEIAQLRADLAQSHAATEKLSRGIWKSC